MKRHLQAVAASAQMSQRDAHRSDLTLDLLTTAEAAARLRYTGPAAVKNFRMWADRHRVPRLYRGRICLWQASVLSAFLRRDRWTRDRHDVRTVAPSPALRKRNSLASKTLDGVRRCS